MATFEQCQSEYDAQTPPDPPWASAWDAVDDALDWAEIKVDLLRVEWWELKKHKGRFDASEFCARLKSIRDDIDEMLELIGDHP